MCKSGEDGSPVAASPAAAFSPGGAVYITKEATWNLVSFLPHS